MTILVVGAGAVGSFLAWALATGGREVHLVRRSHMGVPTASDLVVVDPKGERRLARATIAAAPSDLPAEPAAIVLATKMYDLADAVASCAAWPSAPVVTVQNGIGAEELVVGARPSAGLVAASLTAAIEPSGGGWAWLRPGGIGLSPVQGETGPLIRDLGSVLQAAGLRVRTYDDPHAMKWSKLLGNLVANASAAILDMDAGRIYRDPGLFRIERAQIREALAVMTSLGLRPVALPGADVRLLIAALRLPAAIARPVLARAVGSARGGKDPSLLLHVRSSAGPSEVDRMNGAVVRTGEQGGIATPVNRRLAQLVDDVIADPDRRAWFRHQPDRLVAAMRENAG